MNLTVANGTYRRQNHVEAVKPRPTFQAMKPGHANHDKQDQGREDDRQSEERLHRSIVAIGRRKRNDGQALTADCAYEATNADAGPRIRTRDPGGDGSEGQPLRIFSVIDVGFRHCLRVLYNLFTPAFCESGLIL